MVSVLEPVLFSSVSNPNVLFWERNEPSQNAESKLWNIYPSEHVNRWESGGKVSNNMKCSKMLDPPKIKKKNTKLSFYVFEYRIACPEEHTIGIRTLIFIKKKKNKSDGFRLRINWYLILYDNLIRLWHRARNH